MAVQTSYSVYHDAKYAGQVNKLNPFDTVSRLNSSGETIKFGYGVVSDGEGGATAPSSTDTALTFIGVAMRELNRAYEDSATFGAPDGYDLTVVTSGRVAVVAGATVAVDDPVYFIVGDDSDDNDSLGKFSNVIGADETTGVLISTAKFEEAGVDGDVVWVKFK